MRSKIGDAAGDVGALRSQSVLRSWLLLLLIGWHRCIPPAFAPGFWTARRGARRIIALRRCPRPETISTKRITFVNRMGCGGAIHLSRWIRTGGLLPAAALPCRRSANGTERFARSLVAQAEWILIGCPAPSCMDRPSASNVMRSIGMGQDDCNGSSHGGGAAWR